LGVAGNFAHHVRISWRD